MCQLLMEQGEIQPGLQHCQRAAEIARRSGSVYDEVFNLGYIMLIRLYQGDIAAAQDLNTRIEPLLKFTVTTGPAWHVSTICRALLCHMQGQFDRAMALYNESLEQSASQGDQGYHVTTGLNRGLVLLDLEKWEEAAQALAQTKQVSDTSFGGDNTIDALFAVACARLGRVEESRMLLARAESLSGAAPSFLARFTLAQAQAHLAWAEGNWPRAWSAFEQVARLGEKVGFRWFLGRIWREWAEATLARGEAGDVSRARQLLERALELYQACGMSSHAGRVQARLAEIED
jgi:tetratricopeptide (TPR) repeat protein